LNDENLSARLARTEAALAHLERNYDGLNAVVIDQGRQLARLLKRLEELGQAFQAQEPDRMLPHNQKPPHYSP
jgi:uncharacterized coiled-coil protein SlyX